MFDWLRKMFSRGPSERKLVRHTALTVNGWEIGFVAVEVPEAEYRRKVREKKGEFLLRAKPDGSVAAICNSCRGPLNVVQQDELVWFRCPLCRRVSLNPTANVQRNVQFAIHDGEPFEEEMYYIRSLPPGLDPPFSAEEVGDLAWAKSPQAVIPVPDQTFGGTGAAGLQEVENAIVPYVQKARSTYPDAKRRFLSGLPDGAAFFTTVKLHDNAGRMEQVFVQVMKIEGGRIAGVIASDITTVTSFHEGQAYTFPETEVLDWTIANPDGTQEGNLVGRFLFEWRKLSLPPPSQKGGKQPTFLFTVEHVFYEPRVDRVILGGTVSEGTVKVGDSLTVQCQSGDVAVVLEDIVTLDRGKVQQASRGQQVCLILRGIRKEQPAPGDRVVANAA
jgi:uncharacterized protein YegJ (DUF2314 family)